MKEKADQNFVNELRFLSTRMMGLSVLAGLNFTAFAYFGAIRHFKLYIGIPLTVTTFFLMRNYELKLYMMKMYYSIEPLYEEVRRHQTVSAATPLGAKGVRDIEKVSQAVD